MRSEIHNDDSAQSEVEEFNPIEEEEVLSSAEDQPVKVASVLPEWGNQSRSIKEGSQLFRTQKIAGLAALS